MAATVLSSTDPLLFFTNDLGTTKELAPLICNSFFNNENPFLFRKPEEETQVKFWENYILESATIGVYATLKKYLVQFQFPIKENISQSEEYKNATLKGIPTQALASASGLILHEPEKLAFSLHRSMAGKIPVIVTNNRSDFKSVVRALTYRNEPRHIPDSMGAAMIKGLNNWHRLRTALRFAPKREVLNNKELYQDRIIVLCRNEYSNVSAEMMHLPRDKWLDYSLQIRLEHESAHYFTLRQFGKMSNHIHDEFVADYMGICSVLPEYRSEWFLKFMGLENYPYFREGGRLKNYLGKPNLSPKAFRVFQKIIIRASEHLEVFDAEINKTEKDPYRLLRLCTICKLNLVEMAGEQGVDLLRNTFEELQKIVK